MRQRDETISCSYSLDEQCLHAILLIKLTVDQIRSNENGSDCPKCFQFYLTPQECTKK